MRNIEKLMNEISEIYKWNICSINKICKQNNNVILYNSPKKTKFAMFYFSRKNFYNTYTFSLIFHLYL